MFPRVCGGYIVHSLYVCQWRLSGGVAMPPPLAFSALSFSWVSRPRPSCSLRQATDRARVPRLQRSFETPRARADSGY